MNYCGLLIFFFEHAVKKIDSCLSIIIKIINFKESKIEFSKFCSYATTIFNILDNSTQLWMTKYIIGEFFSSTLLEFWSTVKGRYRSVPPFRMVPFWTHYFRGFSSTLWVGGFLLWVGSKPDGSVPKNTKKAGGSLIYFLIFKRGPFIDILLTQTFRWRKK